MREIKFRGERKDNNKWIFGYLFNDGFGAYYIGIGYPDKWSAIGDGYEEVDPKTVGQYIEINDRKDKEIYGGDIVENRFGNRGVVIKEDACWRVEGFEFKHWYDLEVIGNIHDNPELEEMVKDYEKA